MTTAAFDGTYMAADSKATDGWGLIELNIRKIVELDYILIGGAGESGQIQQWTRKLTKDQSMDELLRDGYPAFDKDKNDPSLVVVDRLTRMVYRHVSGLFMPCSRRYHAVGSGRDYALAAMALGRTAQQAVELASTFDNGTGGEVLVVKA